MDRIWQYNQPIRLDRKIYKLSYTFVSKRKVHYKFKGKVILLEVNPFTVFDDIKKDIKNKT